jgi:zinc protease
MKLKFFFFLSIALILLNPAANHRLFSDVSLKTVWSNPPEVVILKDSQNPGSNLSYLFQHDPTSKITVVHIFIKGGKRAVPASMRGLCSIATALSVEIPETETISRFMTMGSSLYYQVEGDFSVISIRSLTEHIDETLKILSNILKKPLISSLRISNVKKQMDFREKREHDSTEQLMMKIFFDSFSGNTEFGYGGSIYGSSTTRKAIKRKNILSFYKRYFTLSNMVFSVSSDLQKADISLLFKKYYSSLPAGENVLSSESPSPPLSLPQQKSHFIKKEQLQVLISFGFLLPAADTQNFARLYMLDNLLGKGVGSKLWSLRSINELAYNPNSSYVQMKEGGLLIVYLKTDSPNRLTAYLALRKIIRDIHKNGISTDELIASAERSKADFLRLNETKAKRTYNMGYFESLGLKAGYLESFFTAVSAAAAAPDDFNRFIKEVIDPKRAIEVIIGPEAIDRSEETIR